MDDIRVSYAPVFVSLIWSWFLWWIPTVVIAARVYGSKYRYDNEKIIIERGIFNKSQQSVPLYRITDISARKSIFNYGTITIIDKTKIVFLKYVYNPLQITEELRNNWSKAKTTENVTHNEVF